MPELPCPAPVTVDVRIAAGTLEITAEPRDTAIVTVSPWDGGGAAEETAARTTVQLRGDRLFVETPDHRGGWLRRGARVRVDIRVPLDCPLELRAASADVRCHGRYAAAQVSTASGDIAIEHVTGDAMVKTASGHILIDRVDGRSRTNSSSGDVTLTLAGGDVTAHATSGDVTIDEADGSVSASTASGALRIGRARRGAVRLKAASGEVSVGVAQGTGVWLDVVTASGRTHSDLDMTGAPVGDRRPDLTLSVRTASGDIDIHRVIPAAA